MRTQEVGGYRRPEPGAKSVALTTSYASGEGLVLKRRRLARERFRNRKMVLTKTGARASGSRRNFIKVKMAQRKGTGTVISMKNVGPRKRSGLYRITRTKSQGRVVHKLHDTSRSSYRIPASPWLVVPAKVAAGRLPRHYESSLRFQLKRLGKV
jgi:hypothetical protein